MNIRSSIALVLISTAAFAGDPPTPPACATTTRAELRYSPNGECTNAIVNELDNAKSKILMLAYSFTSEPITAALIRAKNRGLEVQAIIDSDRLFEKSNCTAALAKSGLGVYGDPAHAIQHQKVMIIDPDKEESILILGSFNFTQAAEKSNSEVVCILRSHEAAVAAEQNWIMHKGHSKSFSEFSPKEKPGFWSRIPECVAIGISIVVPVLFCLLVMLFVISRKNK